MTTSSIKKSERIEVNKVRVEYHLYEDGTERVEVRHLEEAFSKPLAVLRPQQLDDVIVGLQNLKKKLVEIGCLKTTCPAG